MAYTAITVEGGLFPADLLDLIATGDAPGQSSKDFDQPDARRLNAEFESAFSDICAHWKSFEARRRNPALSLESVTRDWMRLAFETLNWRDLPYQAAALEAGGDRFVISNPARFGEDGIIPIDIISFEHEPGRRYPGTRRSSYASVQEYLNRADPLWGMATNGRVIWLLRDSNRVSHPTYVEFDLAAMVSNNLFAEFRLLYRLLHRTRFPNAEIREENCLLETYYQSGLDSGNRVRARLRDGVENALQELGSALLAPANTELREALRSTQITSVDLYRELLRLVYRFLFLLVVEERKLLFASHADDRTPIADDTVQAQLRYTRYYSMAALRDRAEQYRPDDSFGDAWEGVKSLFDVLSGEIDWAAPALGLSPLNGELFGPDACRHLIGASCANVHFLRAIRHLTTFVDGNIRRRVNFAGLDVEELGSVYESLLDLQARVDLDSAQPFELILGGERKEFGAYYTPSSLVRELIKSALEPVMQDRLEAAARQSGPVEAPEPGDRTRTGLASTDRPPSPTAAKERAILDMKICDPACGSGHFLLAAARRMARELARIRSGEDEPAPVTYREALRDVIRQCIYGVDRNALAVDLCKVALWIEGYNSGLPLSFLDNHIRHGDSLVGVFDLEVLKNGIPDGAYTATSGDDKAVANSAKRANREDQGKQLSLLVSAIEPEKVLKEFAPEFARLAIAEERAAYATKRKAAEYGILMGQSALQAVRRGCDLWTAAFFQPYQPVSADANSGGEFQGIREVGSIAQHITTATVRAALETDGEYRGAGEDAPLRSFALKTSREQPFFHWPLEFPEVFATADERSRGFDVVLGNPPWEQIQPEEIKFFQAAGATHIAGLSGARRKAAIGRLETDRPALARRWNAHKRAIECVGKAARGSKRFLLTATGKLNTYALFAECNRTILSPAGRAGCIVPTGIATDDTTKDFFADLMGRKSLASLFDFENRKGIFPAVDSRMKFCLLTLAGAAKPREAARFAFFLHDTVELADAERTFTMSDADIALFNPNTRTAPIFRTRRDFEITRGIYERVPVLIDESKPPAEGNPWGISFRQGLFNMTSDSHLFRTRDQLESAGYQLDGNIFRRAASGGGSGGGRSVGVREGQASAAAMPIVSVPAPAGVDYPEGTGGGLELTRVSAVEEFGGDVYLPLYEAKMIHQFDHRWATYLPDGSTRDMTDGEKADASCVALPRYWVPSGQVDARLGDRWDRQWLLGWRDITNTTNERTVIASTFPSAGVGNQLPLMHFASRGNGAASLGACLSSFAADFAARFKVGGTHLNFFVFEQLAVLPPDAFDGVCPWQPPSTLRSWVEPRIVELTYTAWDMQSFARDLSYNGPPFTWDPERRFQLRCELDAAFFHLYGINRDDVDYIMGTFPIVRRKDETAHGSYRTKERILELYDEMDAAARSAPAIAAAPKPPESATLWHIAAGEGPTVEYKSSLRWDVMQSTVSKELPKVIAKIVAGFLNANGGTLLIGVTDAGEICGIEPDLASFGKKQDADVFQMALVNTMKTYIGVEFGHLWSASFESVNGKTVCLVDVKPAPKPVWLTDGVVTEFYLRQGSTTQSLNGQQAYEYILMHWHNVRSAPGADLNLD